MRHRWPLALILIALLVAACSSPSGSPAESEAAESQAAESQEPGESAAAGESAAPGEMTSVFDLENGQCFQAAEGDIVEEVEVVGCTTPHDYEIYHVVDHPAGPSDAWIGDDEMQAFVDTECKGAFESFVGTTYNSSTLFIYFLAPTENTWSGGDREVICSLYLPDEQLDESMEGSGV
jgi:hypothetical protein